MTPCVFCAIGEGEARATFVKCWPDAFAIVPLNPVTAGHVIVMPYAHVADALAEPLVTATVMARAAELATADCNLITSVGPAATQTVRHLHVHIVPRHHGDGLALPWTAQSVTAEASPDPTSSDESQ